MNKVFIIQGSSGSYEDAYTWLECAYLDEQLANDELVKLNDNLRLRKEINKKNIDFCNGDDEFCDGNCDDCKYEYDYNLDEQHDYRIVECELK